VGPPSRLGGRRAGERRRSSARAARRVPGRPGGRRAASRAAPGHPARPHLGALASQLGQLPFQRPHVRHRAAASQKGPQIRARGARLGVWQVAWWCGTPRNAAAPPGDAVKAAAQHPAPGTWTPPPPSLPPPRVARGPARSQFDRPRKAKFGQLTQPRPPPSPPAARGTMSSSAAPASGAPGVKLHGHLEEAYRWAGSGGGLGLCPWPAPPPLALAARQRRAVAAAGLPRPCSSLARRRARPGGPASKPGQLLEVPFRCAPPPQAWRSAHAHAALRPSAPSQASTPNPTPHPSPPPIIKASPRGRSRWRAPAPSCCCGPTASCCRARPRAWCAARALVGPQAAAPAGTRGSLKAGPACARPAPTPRLALAPCAARPRSSNPHPGPPTPPARRQSPEFQARTARVGPVAERTDATPVFLNPIRNRIPGHLRGPNDLVD
jgi:hypothetical protein